jgi:hypothetical protein
MCNNMRDFINNDIYTQNDILEVIEHYILPSTVFVYGNYNEN